ncbi:hypothetical protein [Streptosporangium sp. NPDC049046]|uniref:hypothetical protein n=2 Tax=unclassified Streptosporangium TaxID=2632669 RepID=UPI00342B6587
MIVSMRRVAQRGGVTLALGLAALGAVILMHLALCVVAPAHRGHFHAPGHWSPAAATTTITATAAGPVTAIDAEVPTDHVPCPAPPPAEEDHHLCGAAAGAQITGTRAPVPTGPVIGDPVAVDEAPAPPPSPAWRRARPVRPPPGAVLLLLKSVSRI